MIRIASDIHSEFFQLEDIPAMALQALPKMEDDKETMLVLAGDIGSMHKPANLGSFIDEVAPRFKHVYYIPGNHEFYGGNIQSACDVIAILIKPHKNVTFSNCGSFDNIHMTTLWTDFEGGNPVSMNEAAAYMNDYRLINNGKRRNSPTDILQMHTAMRQHLETFVKEGDIVITHHAPSFQSVPEEYKHERINGAYASDLEDLILRKKPAVWFHGHMHTAKDYMIGNTRIIINPRGYGNQHKSNGYNPRLVVDIEETTKDKK